MARPDVPYRQPDNQRKNERPDHQRLAVLTRRREVCVDVGDGDSWSAERRGCCRSVTSFGQPIHVSLAEFFQVPSERGIAGFPTTPGSGVDRPRTQAPGGLVLLLPASSFSAISLTRLELESRSSELGQFIETGVPGRRIMQGPYRLLVATNSACWALRKRSFTLSARARTSDSSRRIERWAPGTSTTSMSTRQRRSIRDRDRRGS